ncbi:MAG: thiol oxidoreductase [Bacteroidetes bacterium]|nr:MAG: thiol oxidoreductase [Bacteroidota bacterium]
MRTIILLLLTSGILAVSCEKILPALPADEDVLDGPVEGLTAEQQRRFLDGDIAFANEFSPQTGLGPIFVNTSCISCHAGDGKGHPFTTLTRYGQADSTGNTYLLAGGPQLQHRAIPGHSPELLPAGAPFSKFLPPANTGLGFLAALTDAQLLANADPNDANGDGISGVPNYINPPGFFVPQSFHQSLNGRYIGRFGRKAGAIDLLQQTVGAYKQDIGVTSEFDPNDPINYAVSSQPLDNIPDPEVSTADVRNVVFYLRTLKAPVQRNTSDADVAEGKQLFVNIGCAKCHIPEWTTPASDIAALGNKTFYPYTDLLLHDMGPGLDDGYTEGKALSSEWRTTPLWGLGLSKNSQGGEYFLMHDGRAKTIREAILLHGGEGQGSRDQFNGMSETEKLKLEKFLESL